MHRLQPIYWIPIKDLNYPRMELIYTCLYVQDTETHIYVHTQFVLRRSRILRSTCQISTLKYFAFH